MPNHWHLVLYPKQDGAMSSFMGWLTNTHTRRWHVSKGTVGEGHLYQGRYKSFICQQDNHFLTLVRYVESNAKQANLVKKAEKWRWSSAWRRAHGTGKQQTILSPWPVTAPQRYLRWLNRPLSAKEEQALKQSTQKGSLFGNEGWVARIAKRFHLESTLRFPGRPKNGG